MKIKRGVQKDKMQEKRNSNFGLLLAHIKHNMIPKILTFSLHH